jgi:demethylmenaquinone methyltransferase/2-methoxy-6-polyprenyl-1,4-benzoquinol methylase
VKSLGVICGYVVSVSSRAMSKFAHDDVVPYKQSQLGKKEQVAKMFDSIAFRYDFLNRFLSFGNDVRWRKKAISQLKELQPQNVLDVATGTADIAILTYKILHAKKIIGIDISEGMLELGRKKIEKENLQQFIELQTGDSETISFTDNSFDAVTVAFGVRNFQNLEKGLQEMLRVLKPEGKLVVLEFSRPTKKIFRLLCNVYMNIITPQAGRVFAHNKDAYRYLNHSVQTFPERENFTAVMKQAGYSKIYFKSLTLGICCIYCGCK